MPSIRRSLGCGSTALFVALLAACSGDTTRSGPGSDESQQRLGDESSALVEPGTCAHAPCDAGDALDATCDPCVQAICDVDPFCCQGAWDGLCVEEVASVCGQTCEPPPPPCAHDTCEVGDPLDPTCDACVQAVCEVDPFCCESFWDAICVSEVETVCGGTCEPPPPPCAHEKCEVGDPLDPACDPCVAAVCDADPFCCTTQWDRLCVEQVAGVCGESCEPPPPTCAHEPCEEGEALDPTCDPCVEAICAADPFCCQGAWDAICVSEVATVCGGTCEPPPPLCVHEPCDEGAPLEATCDPCVTAICELDPFCCQSSWDAICVQAVASVCNESCEPEPGCTHDKCEAGELLDAACDPCVAAICAVDPFCCEQQWDGACVAEVASVCNESCNGR